MPSQEELNNEMARTNKAGFDFIGSLLARVGTENAVAKVIRKGGEKVQDVAKGVESGLQRVQNTTMKLKEVAATVRGSHDAVVQVIRKEFSPEPELNPAFSQEELKAAFDASEIEKDVLIAPEPEEALVGELIEEDLSQTSEVSSSIEEASLRSADEMKEAITLQEELKSSVNEEVTKSTEFADPWVRAEKTSFAQPERNTRVAAQEPVKNSPSSTEQDLGESPQPSMMPHENGRKDTLLYGTKDGEVFGNMTTSDAIAVNGIMRGKVGDYVKGGENLLITSNGETLFETDKDGFVTKNIYQEKPLLLNDREALKSLGLQDLTTYTQYMANTQAEAAEVSKGQNSKDSQADLEKSSKDFKDSTPASDHAPGHAPSYSQDRNASQVLSAYYDQKIEPRLEEMGMTFGSVELADGSQLIKSEIENGFEISFDRQNGNDPVIFGSFEEDLGWAVSGDFSSTYASAMDSELEQGQSKEQEAEQAPVVTPAPTVSATKEPSQSPSMERDNDD